MELEPDQLNIMSIFFPDHLAALQRVQEERRRFVHYTSAEVALSIFRNKCVWMRNALTMNDFSEIEHGTACLRYAWHSDTGDVFRKLLNTIHPGMSEVVVAHFDAWLPHFRNETFLTSFSEHDPHEDRIGRLSMWRAYGGVNGVALVFNNTPFMAATDALKANSSPVAYDTAETFRAKLALMSERIIDQGSVLLPMSKEHLSEAIFNLLRMTVLCTKHPGFAEEREWRVFYSPSMARSDSIMQDIVVIRGIPQVVHKIPLKNDPTAGLYNADLNSLIDHVIIGPCQTPFPIYQALVLALDQADVKNAGSKVSPSEIPLRT